MSDINYMAWNLDFTRRLLTRTNNARFVQHYDSTDIVRVTVQGVDKSTSSASWNVLYKLENDSHIYKMGLDSSVSGDTTTLDWHVPASLLADDGAVGMLDKVGNSFYTSASGTAFMAGPTAQSS